MVSDNPGGMIPAEEARQEVVRLARRMAMMYHHVGQVLVERLGKKAAREILREAIWRYGEECGKKVRETVQAMGLPLTVENFDKARDLPRYGWEARRRYEGGVARPVVTYCPLAAVWLEKGSAELGRIYCLVDEAKYLSYNGIRCVHVKNLLDGDDCCEFSIGEPGTGEARRDEA